MTAVGEKPDTIGLREPPMGPGGSLDLLFRLALVACLVLTVVVLLPGVHGHAIQPAFDLVLDTIAAIVCGMVVALAWSRFRERRVVAAAYHAAAFLALAMAYGVAVLVSLQHAVNLGDLAAPEDVQMLVFAVAHLGAAILFVIAGAFTSRPTYGRLPVWILVAPTLAVLAAALVGRLIAPPDALLIVAFEDDTGLPHIAPFGAVLQLATATLFFVGAYVNRGLWRRDRNVLDGWIAIGLVFAGFAELTWMMYPSAHPGQVSTADLLRLACSACLMIGIASAFRIDQRQLRQANLELAELRASEVERAALEERTRLARELHDGLAQDLWLAKLRTGELAAMELPEDARRAAENAAAAIDVGLAGAREAVSALRSSAHADSGFCSLVRQTVEDHGDRFGLRVEYSFEGEHTTRIDPRTQAETLRIAQEALANIARHAEATLVGVRLTVTRERLTLRLADNGRGFNPAAEVAGYGLLSMRERAALIGGKLRVASAPDAGTVVILTAPLERPASRPGSPALAAAEQA